MWRHRASLRDVDRVILMDIPPVGAVKVAEPGAARIAGARGPS